MLTGLGGLAEFERELIRGRTGEGRERAKAQGVKIGHKPKPAPHQMPGGDRRHDRGQADAGDCPDLNVWHSTISRLKAC